MSNQLSIETLAMLFGNTQITDTSRSSTQSPVEFVLEPDPEYVSKDLVPQPYGETVFILSQRTADLLKTDLKEFYSKFIAALSLEENNISIVVVEETGDVAFSDIISDQNVKCIVYWGIQGLLKEKLSLYVPQLQNEKIILWTDAMESIEKDQSLKIKLWKAVKQVFK